MGVLHLLLLLLERLFVRVRSPLVVCVLAAGRAAPRAHYRVVSWAHPELMPLQWISHWQVALNLLYRGLGVLHSAAVLLLAPSSFIFVACACVRWVPAR